MARVEISLSDEQTASLDSARGFEPRASFVKRALEQALRRESGDAMGTSPSVPDVVEFEPPAPARAPVEKGSTGGASAEKQKPRPASTAGSASSRRAGPPSIRETWGR